MGVIKERRTVEDPNQEGGINNATSQENLALAPPPESLPPPPVVYRRYRPRSASHKNMNGDDTMPVPRSSKIGAKKLRRYENICELVSMCADEDFGDLTIRDFMPNSRSVFTQLLENSNLMQMWNEFIGSSEETQSLVLRTPTAVPTDDDDSIKASGIDQVQQLNPDAAFSNIDRELRNTLKQRGLPLGIVQSLEEEVINFFMHTPASVYISQALPGFQRLLLHALCQYNTLISHSFGREGRRQVRVDNPNDGFIPPSCTLVEYLEKRRLQLQAQRRNN